MNSSSGPKVSVVEENNSVRVDFPNGDIEIQCVHQFINANDIKDFINKILRKLNFVSAWPCSNDQVDAKTMLKYSEKTFYMTTQTWRLGRDGDAICGLGPNYDCHVVVRIGDNFAEDRGPNACLVSALAKLNYIPVID